MQGEVAQREAAKSSAQPPGSVRQSVLVERRNLRTKQQLRGHHHTHSFIPSYRFLSLCRSPVIITSYPLAEQLHIGFNVNRLGIPDTKLPLPHNSTAFSHFSAFRRPTLHAPSGQGLRFCVD